MRFLSALILGTVLSSLAPAYAGSHRIDEPIAVKDASYTDPHRGTTFMRDATITFVGVEEHASVANQLLVQSKHEINAHGKFVVLSYTVTNNHPSDVLDIYPLFFGGCRLVDDAGGKHEISKVSGQFAQAMGIDMQGKRMEPGASIKSCIVFDIPADASPATLEIDLIDARVALAGAGAGM